MGEFIEKLVKSGLVRDVMDGWPENGRPPRWARPAAPPAPLTADEAAAAAVEGNPFMDPDHGLLPGGPCFVCGGTHGHDPACPTGVEATAVHVADPARVAVMRRYAPAGKPYDPVADLTARAAAADVEEDPDGVRGSKAWAAHYRRAAAIAADLIAAAPSTTTPEPDDGLPAGETALQYIDRPARVKPPAASNKKAAPKAAGPRLFGASGADSYESGV